jgi:hypothetical protein
MDVRRIADPMSEEVSTIQPLLVELMETNSPRRSYYEREDVGEAREKLSIDDGVKSKPTTSE